MRLPRTVKINGKRYKVKLKRLSHRGLLGLCFLGRRREIHVDNGIPPDERAETFLHEVLHACFEGLPYSDRTEEKIIETMSPRLLAALQSAGWVKL